MSKVFHRNNDVDAVRKIVSDLKETFFVEADIISVSKSSSTAQVRMRGSSNTTRVLISKGITVEQNDHVVLLRSPQTSQWIILGAYVNPQTSGNTTTTTTQVLAPSNVTVGGVFDLMVVRWEIGVDTTGTFEVEVADDTSETGAVFILVAGSTLPYVSSSVKHFRVRTIDVSFNRSGWSSWVTGTPTSILDIAHGGTGVDLTATGPAWFIQPSTGSNVTALKSNFSAAVPPTTSNDTSQGYAIKSLWFDTTHSKLYACFDATTSAAVWKELTNPTTTNLVFKEQDGTPSVSSVVEVHVPNGSLTDLGAGVVQLDVATGGGGDGLFSGALTTKSYQQRTVLVDLMLGSDQATIDFTSIDQSYDHLEIIASLQGYGTEDMPYKVYYNNDTTENHYYNIAFYHGSSGNNTTTNMTANDSTAGFIACYDSGAGYFSNVRATIDGYRKAAYKLSKWHDNEPLATSHNFYSNEFDHLWLDTTAISRITLVAVTRSPATTSGFKAGSRIQLIGVKTEAVVTDVSSTALITTRKSAQTRTVLYDNTLVTPGIFDVASIDQTYDHLELIATLRDHDWGGNNSESYFKFNNDGTTAHYKGFQAYAGPSGAIGSGSIANTAWANIPANTATSTEFGVIRALIPNYANTTQHKTMEATMSSMIDNAADGYIVLRGWVWRDTSAINQITIAGNTYDNLETGSRLQIIGVKTETILTDVVGGLVNPINYANQNYAMIVDQKTSGADGGTFTSGTWQTRDLTIILTNMAVPLVLSSNQVTVPAGTYKVTIKCPAYAVNNHNARLQNITDSTTLIEGTNEWCRDTTAATFSSSIISGIIILDTPKVLEVQHICSTTHASSGFASATNLGSHEIYTTFEIERIDSPTISLTQFSGVRYKTDASQTFADASSVVIDYDVMDYDTDASVTTGASWHYLVANDGYYRVTGSLAILSIANTQDLVVFVNGALFAALSYAGSRSTGLSHHHGEATLHCAAGDLIDFRIFNNTGGSITNYGASGGDGYNLNYVTIEKIG